MGELIVDFITSLDGGESAASWLRGVQCGIPARAQPRSMIGPTIVGERFVLLDAGPTEFATVRRYSNLAWRKDAASSAQGATPVGAVRPARRRRCQDRGSADRLRSALGGAGQSPPR